MSQNNTSQNNNNNIDSEIQKSVNENIVFAPNNNNIQRNNSESFKYNPILPKLVMIPVTKPTNLNIYNYNNDQSEKTEVKEEQMNHNSSSDLHSSMKNYSKNIPQQQQQHHHQQQSLSSSSVSSASEREAQKLACNNCRARRTKCDRKEPCGRCESRNLVCETSSLDLRKKRVRAVDVDKLERRIKELENLLALKMGQSIVADGNENNPNINNMNHETFVSKLENNVTSFYNPSKDENIIKSIKNFFKFLYPGLTMFIHRESFLHSFFNEYSSNYKESKYCSIELVYAVAALGSQLSDDLKQFSEKYFTMAKEGVLQNRVFPKNTSNCVSLITSVQTLLALSLYELGNGNFGQSFYLSGIAFRIGFDMSFQLEPTAWFNLKFYSGDQPSMGFEGNSTITKEDIEIRSRIYWGCYLTDHFICLVLGRNPTLFCYNSTIKDSIEMSETEQTEDFKFQSKHTLLVSIPLKQLIILSRIVEIFTKGFFIEPNISRDKKLHYLAKFNEKLEIWKSSLPGFLKWDQFSLNDPSYSSDPTITYFWYHYYIIVLTFNKPYVEENSTVIRNTLNSLQIMLTNFVNHYDKFNLYQLFAVSIASNILAKFKNIAKTSDLIQYVDDKIYFFNTILKKMSKSYGFATKLVETNVYDDMFNASDTSSSNTDVSIVYSKYSQHISQQNDSNSFIEPNQNIRSNNFIFDTRSPDATTSRVQNIRSPIEHVLEQQPRRKRRKQSQNNNNVNNHFESNNAILSMLLNNQYNTDVDDLTSLLLKNTDKPLAGNEINQADSLKFINVNQQIEHNDDSSKHKYNSPHSIFGNSSNKKRMSQNEHQTKSLFSKAPQELINNIKHTNDFSFNVEVDEIIKKMFTDDDPEFEKFMNPAHSL